MFHRRHPGPRRTGGDLRAPGPPGRRLPRAIARLGLVALGAALAAAFWVGAAAAQGEKRIALVIGNAAYPEAPLRNPVNDARAMARSLRGRGFEVMLRENATKSQMDAATVDFGEKLTEGATGLFFYAGHGMQVNGRNFLVPVDAKLTTEQRVRVETLDVDIVLEQMAVARARVSVMILDACRNNPFERRVRATGGGLAQINAPEGTLIAYATAPGKVAADGAGANGLYTAELLRAMATPGLKIEDVFKQVRVSVSKASNGAQIPWEASSLTGDFYFAAVPAPAPTAAPAAAPPAQGDRELVFWESIKGSSDPADFRDYLQRYPDGFFAPLAKRRIETLESTAKPAPAPAPRPAPGPTSAPPRPSASPTTTSGQAPGPSTALPQDFNGIYRGSVTDGHSKVEPLTTTLTREGDQVTGRFRTECCEGVITGRVLGNALIYDWQTPNARGQAFATIQDDGTIFGILGIAVSVFGGGDWRVRRAP